MNISRGKKLEAQKVCIYGPEGIGKSTLAAQFPNPLFIDTEGSTTNMDVARMDRPSSFTMLMQQITYVRDNPNVCSSLIIDTADWAEMLCMTELCSKKQITGIEDIGYGKGYVYLAEDFGKMLNLLEEVKDKGINIVITAHATMRKFEQPDELGAYDRWELKLQKKTAPLLKEWADMVLFANYKTFVVNVDDKGTQKGKNKAQGGSRVIYTTHHPCWDAKNRHDLPDELPMDYKAIAHCIPDFKIGTHTKVSDPEPVKESPVPTATTPTPTTTHEPVRQSEPKPEQKPVTTPKEEPKEETAGVPKALLDLMKNSPFKVTVDAIQDAVSSRGYYPIGTPIANYDQGFIDGCLIAAWDKVLEMIRDRKLQKDEFLECNPDNPSAIPDSIPFNN